MLGKNVDSSLYRSMIGSLLYLTASRPDISCSVRVCARYQANPKESYIIVLKRIIKYVKGTRIIVTLDFIFEILHVPRVAHLDYPGCQHLRTVSKDKFLSHFYETPSIWGERQNTLCSSFIKGPRFLNMMMTFVLIPFSHYNFIIEPHARFLLSLLKDLSINFPCHLIISIIDVYRDTTTRDKLIFPLAIIQILHHFSIPILDSPLFTVMGDISAASIRRSEAQLQQSGYRPR